MRPGLYTAAKIQCLFYLWFCSFSNLYHHLYLICTKCRNVMSAAVFTKVTQTWSWETWVFWVAAAAAAKSLQSCPTLCDSIDGSPPGSPVTGTLQARTLEWVAISFSNAWKWKVKMRDINQQCSFVTTLEWDHHERQRWNSGDFSPRR